MRWIDDILRALGNLFEGLPSLLKFIVVILFEKLLGDYFWFSLAAVVGAITAWLLDKHVLTSHNKK